MRSLAISRMVQDRGLTPKDMADLFGISERTWYYWMSDPDKHMTVGKVRILSDALRLSEWEIVEVIKGRRK